MAGHSKWANIRFRKGAQDIKRSKIFTKLIREIVMATRVGGADPQINARLRDAITKALRANMKRSTIDGAIQRGSGQSGEERYDEARYEAYGPQGSAWLIDCLTDNRNRTISELRYAFNKHGGSLSAEGSVAYLFKRYGHIELGSALSVDEVLDVIADEPIEDIDSQPEQGCELLVLPEHFEHLKQVLLAQSWELEQAELTMLPSNWVVIEDEPTRVLMGRLLEALQDLDDVQHVYTNVR